MKGEHTVTLLCEVLGASPSAYYRWCKKGTSRREKDDQWLRERIRQIHRKSRGNYGAPRIVAELAAEGVRISRRRCARLMRECSLQGRKRHARHPRTTDSRHPWPVPENRLASAAPPDGPDQVWITDITYIRTAEGWLFLAAILDAWSRRVIGWATGVSLHTWLVLAALRNALLHRKPSKHTVHHSDRGCQYASGDYQSALADANLLPSMSAAGNCYDNATMESFWSTLKTESGLEEAIPATRHDARLAIFDYIETFYNPLRRHSSLDYLSPVAFEQNHNIHITKAA